MLAFALPVLARSDGLPDTVPDITELGHLLHPTRYTGIAPETGTLVLPQMITGACAMRSVRSRRPRRC